MAYPDSQYDYTSPIVIAANQTPDIVTPGASPLVLQSPFGQEACEYAIQLISFEGAGTLAIGGEGQAAKYAATNDGGVRGYVMKAVNGQIIPVEPCFTPLRNGKIYASINMAVAGQLCAVTFLFRRSMAEHVQQFSPMLHTTNPDDMDMVNAARAQAAERAAFPSTPGRSGRGS
jgi:hypothetical protein